jgi:hypothetical protein
MHRLMQGTDAGGSFRMLVHDGSPWPPPEDEGSTKWELIAESDDEELLVQVAELVEKRLREAPGRW